MIKEIKTKIQNPYDTEENWKNSSRILKKGEIAYTSDRGGGYYKVGNGVDLWKDLPYPIDNHTHKIENVNGLEYELNARTEYSTTRGFNAGDESTHTYKIIRIKCNYYYCSFDFEFSLISRNARLNNKYRLSFAMDGNHNLYVDGIIFEHYTENSNNVHAYAIQDADGSYYIDIYAEVYAWDMVFLYKDREMNTGGSEITTPLERDVQEPETYLKKVYPSPITYPKAKHDQNGNVINETYALLSHTHAISDVTGLQTTLDGKPKYETGTWTPSNTVGAPTDTSVYDFRDSKYKKIGDIVILTTTASATNYESKDGSLVITRDSFPFALGKILSTFSTNIEGKTSIGVCNGYGEIYNFGKYNFAGASNGFTDVSVAIIYSL